MVKPRLLDLFCCAGGAAIGYSLAGFEVIGVDIEPQPHYPYVFEKHDVKHIPDRLVKWADVIHASPPCQAHTRAQRIRKNTHEDLIQWTRLFCEVVNKPYVIENVVGAPLINPITLCGEMFHLGTYRDRLFESNLPIAQPWHPPHIYRTTKMGRKPVPGEMMHVVGNFSGVKEARAAMGFPSWSKIPRDRLREAIPPAYTHYIGEEIRRLTGL